mgnify:CR=1 FL=1
MLIEENTKVLEEYFDLVPPVTQPVFNMKLWKHKTKDIFAWNMDKSSITHKYKIMFVSCPETEIRTAIKTAPTFFYKTQEELLVFITNLTQ